MRVKKRVRKAFGKNVFYLGIDKEPKEHHWLEEASWDCGHYWGFGYVKTYTNNSPTNPGGSKDISSHSHFESLLDPSGPSIISHALEMPLKDSEKWELADLMRSFYILKGCSELFKNGNAHWSSNQAKLKDIDQYKRINTFKIPSMIKRVYEILSPVGEEPVHIERPIFRVEG